MRKVLINGVPPQDWVDKANELTEKLKQAPDVTTRTQIIKDNLGFWRDIRIRDWLLAQFANKCWYTEAMESVSAYHVDHFRPKGRITNPDKSNEDEEDLIKAENTIEILGLNRLARLNHKRGLTWRNCKMKIADFQSAASCSEFRHQKKIMQFIAVNNLKECIAYKAEFSSVAEACIRKCAPEPLIARVFE